MQTLTQGVAMGGGGAVMRLLDAAWERAMQPPGPHYQIFT
jgi:hypothetical protein